MATSSLTSDLAQAMTEQSILDEAQKLLENIQRLMNSYTDITNLLEEHKVDPYTHQDIRKEIQGIVSGEGLITRIEALKEISEGIYEHNVTSTAHPDLESKMASLKGAVETLTHRIDKLEPTRPDEGLTSLEKKLKEIDDFYDPTLKALMAAWQAASISNAGTADAIAAEYQKLSQEKAKAVADAMREYQYA